MKISITLSKENWDRIVLSLYYVAENLDAEKSRLKRVAQHIEKELEMQERLGVSDEGRESELGGNPS